MTNHDIVKPVPPVGAGCQRRQLDALVGKDAAGFEHELVSILEIPAALLDVQIEGQDCIAALERNQRRPGPVVLLPGEAPAITFLDPLR